MINPIIEMQAQVTTAKVLQRDLRETLKQKQQAVNDFYHAKAKAEPMAKTPEKITAVEPQKPPEPPKSVLADKEKEQQLLKIAKSRYKSYADVAVFAEELGLRAGVVYLVLKRHNFIQQNETTQYRVLDAYYQCNGNLKAITEKTGLGVWFCAKTLEQLGISPSWASYKERAETGKKGDWAEEEFKRLVPDAVDMNMQYQMNNPVFDFVVYGKTIDVKLATLKKQTRSESQQYHFRVRSEKGAEMPDLFCLFMVEDRENYQNNYRILLVPSSIISTRNTHICISAKETNAPSTMYWDFEVEPAALHMMLQNI